MEISHVCLINANVVGTEVLKNLVLPGIRAFTIIDNQYVTEDDADSNFFLCMDGTIGQSRGKIAAHYLLEINDDVKKGDYLEENFEILLETNINYFTNFNLVIASGINDERSLNKLSKEMWLLNIPLLIIKSIGFIGYIRLQVQEHAILEPRPDNKLLDLRLKDMFPELKSYLDSYKSLEKLTKQELTRVPSLVIIYKYLLEWRQQEKKSDNDVPLDRYDKLSLIKIIQTNMNNLKDSFNDIKDENELNLELDNFEEAIRLVNKIFNALPKIPTELQNLLDEAKTIDCNMIKKSSTLNFWLMMKALNEFILKYDNLPLNGNMPDMNCASDQYLILQKIYKTKATDDINCFTKILNDITGKYLNIPETDIKSFCKNVRYLALIRTSPIYQEMTSKTLRNLASSLLANGTDEEDFGSDQLRFYILMRLLDRFYSKHQRFPGQNENEVDVMEFKVMKNLTPSKFNKIFNSNFREKLKTFAMISDAILCSKMI